MRKKRILIAILSCFVMSLYAQEKRTYWDNGNEKSVTNHDENGEKTGLIANSLGQLLVVGFYLSGISFAIISTSELWSAYI